jgi:hypothetical protein
MTEAAPEGVGGTGAGCEGGRAGGNTKPARRVARRSLLGLDVVDSGTGVAPGGGARVEFGGGGGRRRTRRRRRTLGSQVER